MQTIGLVGLGFIGKTHLEAYQQINQCKVSAICTSNEGKDPEIPGYYKGTIVKKFEDLLMIDEIDIIDICLPTYLHEEYIIKAANAGKHIICEKPLTLTVESANRIVSAVNKNKVKLFVGNVLRFWPEYEVIKSYSLSDKLRDIEIVHARRLGQPPTWSSWFQDPEKSGGALFDLHIHDIDFVSYVLGEVDTVYAVGNKNRYGAWDHVMTTLTFKNNSKAIVEASQRMPMGYPFTFAFRAQTVKNALELTVATGENIENIENGHRQFIYYANQKKSPIEMEKGNAFQNELSYFVNCIENNTDNTVIPLDDVVYTLKILKAIENSLETGKKIRM
jgi:predicted dehydrogenase